MCEQSMCEEQTLIPSAPFGKFCFWETEECPLKFIMKTGSRKSSKGKKNIKRMSRRFEDDLIDLCAQHGVIPTDKLLLRYRKIKTRRVTDEDKNIESIIISSFSPRLLSQSHLEIAIHLSVHIRKHPSSLSTELQTLIFEYLDTCTSWMFLNRYDADQWVTPTFSQGLKSCNSCAWLITVSWKN